MNQDPWNTSENRPPAWAAEDPSSHAEEASPEPEPAPMPGEEEQVAPSEPQPGEAEEAQRRMEELERERDELFTRLQRVSADYQNYTRRSQQNLSDAVELARGDLLRNLIPVLDHFDRALGAEEVGEEGGSVLEGMRMVRDELLKVLEREGVERIDTQVGQPFDPHLHEAMMRQDAEGVAPNHIAVSLQPGYVYKGRTLRPAKVAVATDDEQSE